MFIFEMAIGNGAKYMGRRCGLYFIRGHWRDAARDGDWAEWWPVGEKVVTLQIC